MYRQYRQSSNKHFTGTCTCTSRLYEEASRATYLFVIITYGTYSKIQPMATGTFFSSFLSLIF